MAKIIAVTNQKGGVGKTMTTEKGTEITAAKQEVRLKEWAEQIERQKASGLTMQQWCAENNVDPRTFYYRRRKVREQCPETFSEQSVVALEIPVKGQSENIRIEKNGLNIFLPADISISTAG